MSEYIIDWSGIGAQLTNLYESRTPLYLWPKRIREERRREEIVRCRDCKWRRDFYWNDGERKHRDGSYCCGYRGGSYVKPDGFCSEGERKVER